MWRSVKTPLPGAFAAMFLILVQGLIGTPMPPSVSQAVFLSLSAFLGYQLFVSGGPVLRHVVMVIAAGGAGMMIGDLIDAVRLSQDHSEHGYIE